MIAKHNNLYRRRLLKALPVGVGVLWSKPVVYAITVPPTAQMSLTVPTTPTTPAPAPTTSLAPTTTPNPVRFADSTIVDKVYIMSRFVGHDRGPRFGPDTLPEAAGGSGTIRYSFSPSLPAGLTFSAERVLSGTPSIALAETIHTYVATDTANADNTATLTFSMTIQPDSTPSLEDIEDPPPYIVGVTIDTITFGTASGGNVRSAASDSKSRGGTGYTYSISPTPPPAGLSYDATARTLSGVPEQASAAQAYTYTARDEDGDSATAVFNITVEADTTPVLPASFPDQTYVVGAPVNLTLPIATGGNGTLTYTLEQSDGGLPPGLSFDAPNRRLHGRPTETLVGNEMVYTVTDSNDDPAELNFDIEIIPRYTVGFSATSYRDSVEESDFDGDGIIEFDNLISLNADRNISTGNVPTGLSVEAAVLVTSGSESGYEASVTLPVVITQGSMSSSVPFIIESTTSSVLSSEVTLSFTLTITGDDYYDADLTMGTATVDITITP